MTESMLILTGICVYAAINHAFTAFSQPFSPVHFWFAILCVLLVAYELLHMQTYAAVTITDYVFKAKWEMTIIMGFFGLFPWFISEYTKIRPPWLLRGLAMSAIALIISNVVQPYSLQFAEISRLEQVLLPWGETVSQPVGKNSVVFYFAIVFLFVTFIFAVYALAACYIRERSGTVLAMLLAVGLFMSIATEAILVRLGVIDFINLGHFSILAMIIAMSMALNRDMQQKLRSSAHRFRSLVEQSPFSLQVLSPDGRTLQVNRAWEKLWGISLDQMANYNLRQDQQLRDKGVMPDLEKGFAGQATEITPVVYNPAETPEIKGPVRDRWVRSFIYPIKDETGVVREVVLMHEDVTEKKLFDDAIRLIATGVSEETGEGFFQPLVKSLSKLFATQYAFVGVLDTTDTHCVQTLAVFANGKPAPNLSYDLQGTPCANVVGQHTCIHPRNIQSLFPQDQLLVEMDAEGYIGTPLFDSKGNPLGIIVLIDSQPLRDADQMKAIMEIVAVRAAAEIERSNAYELLRQQRGKLEKMVETRTAELQSTMKELEAFSYSVSHDLRAPLRSIDGFSQVLVEDYRNVLDEQGQDFLSRIRNNTQRMAVLIDDLLKLSRVSRKEIIKQTVNLSLLVGDSFKNQQEQDPLRDIEVKVAKNISAHGDPDLLAIAIDNLVSNAWKYTGKTEHPVVEFGTETKDNKLIYYIKDNGAGFDMQYVHKLFNAFQRLHSADEFEGTGVGLATVDRIINRHGGKIWADAGLKNGAAFYFSLPE